VHDGKYERLIALKNEYDPTNLFRLGQNIKPTAQSEMTSQGKAKGALSLQGRGTRSSIPSHGPKSRCFAE
jgi:hypothetical protein